MTYIEGFKKRLKTRLATLRDQGQCPRCGKKYQRIKSIFGVVNPLSGENELSLLCKKCRSEISDDARMKWKEL